jgi:hypothetical protein
MGSAPSLSRRSAMLLAIISPLLLGANFKCVAVSNPSVTTARIDELEPTAPRVGDVVQARGSGAGTPPMQFSWDFGDGSPDMPGSQAAHIYDSPGTYHITLTVRDAFGALSRDAAQLIVSTRLQVPSQHAILMSNAVAAEPVSFQAVPLEADENELTYVWSFSDGQSFVGAAPTLIFPTRGFYLASVRIASDLESIAAREMTFEVMDAASTSLAQSTQVIGFTSVESSDR